MAFRRISQLNSLWYSQSRQEPPPSVANGSKAPSPIVRKTKLSTILQSIRPPSTGLADITHSCATPPQHRRRIFNRKSIRSPFGHRQSSSVAGDINSTFSGKPRAPQSPEQPHSPPLQDPPAREPSPQQSAASYLEAVIRRRIPTRVRSESIERAYHRLSLGGTSAYAGHLSSMVFSKIKSLWNAAENSGLNQLATGTHTRFSTLFSVLRLSIFLLFSF